MLFNSYSFLLAFLPLLLLAFWLTSVWRAARPALVLLLFSAVFYALSGAGFFVLLLALLGMNYVFGLLLARPDAEVYGPLGLGRKGLLALALFLNLLPLAWFKYSAFLVESLSSLGWLHLSFEAPGLPLGISFYTFIQIAWLVSIYRRSIVPEGLGRHLLFSSCFCYVISGPIVRYEQMGRQFDRLQAPDADLLARGFSLFCMGLGKKVLLADSLASHANAVFNAAERGFPLGGAEAWLGSLCYSFQLYFDFSGYTDMALGLGLMLGLRLPENFNSPYKATGIVDFWRRWHITLSAWLRDFLYIPLGGNRAGRIRQYINLFLTMLLGGLWHGAGLTFIIWGALHGAMLSVNHFFRSCLKGTRLEALLARWPFRLCSIALTFCCINACWVVFRAATPEGALRIWQAMLTSLGKLPNTLAGLASQSGPGGWQEALSPHHYLQGWQPLALLAVSAVIVWGFPSSHEIFQGRRDGSRAWLHWQPTVRWATGLAVLAFASLLLVSRQSSFLYFQF